MSGSMAGGVLLIDTLEALAAPAEKATGLPAAWASFGHPYKDAADHDELFRDPREFAVVVDDSLNAHANWRQEHGEGGTGQPLAPTRNRLGFPLSRYAFALRVRSRYEEALREGVVLVVFAGPPHDADLPPRASAHLNPDLAPIMHLWARAHWPESLSNYGGLPIDEPDDFNAAPGPATVRFHPGVHAFGPYFAPFAAAFGPDMRWHAAWNASGRPGRRHGEYYPLFWNSAGQQVGFVREHAVDPGGRPGQKVGLSVVLPNLEPAARRGEAILFLLGEVLPHLRPDLFPAHWYHAYLPPGLEARRAEVARRRARVERELRAEEQSIAAAAAAFEEYKPLLRLTGAPLRALVARVFRELFGFRVSEVAQGMLTGDPTAADLLLEHEGFRALADVRGFGGRGLVPREVPAFVQRAALFADRHGRTDARLLVVNPHAHLPPPRRTPLGADVARGAARQGVAVLTTEALLGLVERWRVGELDAAGLKTRLATPGEQ
jgi:hypothetical protein